MIVQNNRSKDFRDSMARQNPSMFIPRKDLFRNAEAKSHLEQIFEPYIHYDENDKELEQTDEQSR